MAGVGAARDAEQIQREASRLDVRALCPADRQARVASTRSTAGVGARQPREHD
jgi:hypothetical protein